MNQLANAIQSQSLNGSAKEIVAAFGADTVVRTDSQRWTYAGLAKRFESADVVGMIDEILKATPGMDWVRLALAANGIDFSDPVTQAGLNALEGKLPPDALTQLKAIGIVNGPRWQAAGLAKLPTEAECQFALDQIAFAAWAEQAIDIITLSKNAGQTDIAATKRLITGG